MLTNVAIKRLSNAVRRKSNGLDFVFSKKLDDDQDPKVGRELDDGVDDDDRLRDEAGGQEGEQPRQPRGHVDHEGEGADPSTAALRPDVEHLDHLAAQPQGDVQTLGEVW